MLIVKKLHVLTAQLLIEDGSRTEVTSQYDKLCM